MPTGFYLLDNPNRTQQYRHPRRARLSGMVAVHTAEGVMDDVGIDTGAENVASFIAGRIDYGSYHSLNDSDSTVRMAPDDHETWHVGADAHNWHAWGISAACRTVDWSPNSAWTRATIRSMGAEIAAFWSRNGFDVDQLAGRWLTREQALRHEAGLIEHGVAQPADRSDAWATLALRDTYRQMLTDAILAAHQGDIPQEEDMITANDIEAAVRKVLDGTVAEWERETRRQLRGRPVVQLNGSLWMVMDDDGVLRRRWISGTAELSMLRQIGEVSSAAEINITPDTEVAFHSMPRVEAYGGPF